MAFKFFRPDVAYNDIYLITPHVLAEMGVKGIVFDIDNTIAPYEIIRPTDAMKNILPPLSRRELSWRLFLITRATALQPLTKAWGCFTFARRASPRPRGF